MSKQIDSKIQLIKHQQYSLENDLKERKSGEQDYEQILLNIDDQTDTDVYQTITNETKTDPYSIRKQSLQDQQLHQKQNQTQAQNRYQDKIDSRINQWQSRKEALKSKKDEVIVRNLMGENFESFQSPIESLNTHQAQSSEKLNTNFFNSNIPSQPNSNQKSKLQPPSISQNDQIVQKKHSGQNFKVMDKNSYNEEIVLEYKNRIHERLEKDRYNQVDNIIKISEEALDDYTPQRQTNETSEKKYGTSQEILEDKLSPKNSQYYGFGQVQDLRIVNQLLIKQQQEEEDFRGRINIAKYIEQNKTSNLMNSSTFQKKSTIMTGKKKDTINSDNHDLEIIHTKEMMRKALTYNNKFPTKILRVKRLFKRILSLVQIKRLFTRNYQLSQLQYDLISDSAYHQSAVIETKGVIKHFFALAFHLNKPLLMLKKLLFEKWIKISNQSIIRPESTLNLLWMIAQLIVYIVFLLMVSVTIFFSDQVFSNDPIPTSFWMRFFNVSLVFIMTILDIIKELNCGYYECGEVIIDRGKIQTRYTKSRRFIYDILSCFSLIAEFFTYEVHSDFTFMFQIVKLLIFFKLSLIMDIINKIESQFLFSSNWNNWIHLFKLTIIVLFTCHVMAILYYLQALVQVRNGYSNTWLDMSKLLEEPDPSLRYIQSLYNATCLMVAAIQYNPKDPYEAIFVTLATIGNTAFFGFIVTAIGTIVDDFRKNSKQYKKDLSAINQFMSQTKIPKDLQIRVRNYLQYNHQNNLQVDNNEANEILTQLPLKIRTQVTQVVNSSYLNQISIIQNDFSQNFIQQVLMKMEQLKYIPGDTIFKEKRKDDQSIYLILEGKVEIYLLNRSTNEKKENQEHVIKELTKGEYFGEYSFFTGRFRTASAKASSYCTLVKIKREDFTQTLQYFHEDMEKYKEKQDKLILYQNLSTINLSCYICSSTTHLAKDCNTVHISPFHHTIINVYNRQVDQDREEIVLRNPKVRFNARANMHSLIASAIVIAENYQNILDNLESKKKIHFEFKLDNDDEHKNDQNMFNISPQLNPLNEDEINQEQQDRNDEDKINEDDENGIEGQNQDNNENKMEEQNEETDDKQQMINTAAAGRNNNQQSGVYQFSTRLSIKPPKLQRERSYVASNRSINTNSYFYEQSFNLVKTEQSDQTNNCVEDDNYGSQLQQDENDYESPPFITNCASEFVKSMPQEILQNQIANVSKIKQQVEFRKDILQLKSKQFFSSPSNRQSTPYSDEVDFGTLIDALKNYTYYFPQHNFSEIIKALISKKVVHSKKINILINQVNKIKQTKQKNQIKIKLFQQELKKKQKSNQSNQSEALQKKQTSKSRFKRQSESKQNK